MIHSRASVRFLPQSDPVLQRNTKLNCTLKLQTFVQGLKSATSKPTYARLHPFLRGKHSVDGNKPSRGKGKEIVRLCARSLYTARALCAASLSFSFCSVPFKVSDMCTISVCCYMNRSPVISGLDLRVRLYNLKWSVQCSSLFASFLECYLSCTELLKTTSTMSEFGRWTVVIEYKVSRRSITSPMTQIDTHSLSELGKCLICYSQKSLSWSSWIWRAASHFRVLCLGNLVVCVFF